MEMLSRKLNEERQKFREQMDNELRAQREQMNNMMEANMKSAKQDRELLVQQNQDLQNKFLAFQKANEDNMKEIGKLRDLLAKQDEEKRRLSEQMELKSQAASERQEQMRVEMEKRHKREQAELHRQVEANMKRDLQEYKAASAKREQDMEKKHKQQQDDLRREMEEKRDRDFYCWQSQYQAAADARLQEVTYIQGKLQAVEEELTELKKPPGFFKWVGTKIQDISDAVLENCSIMWQVPRSLF